MYLKNQIIISESDIYNKVKNGSTFTLCSKSKADLKITEPKRASIICKNKETYFILDGIYFELNSLE